MEVCLLLGILSAVSVSIVEPADGGVYDGDWLTLKTIVENENSLPDSVVFSLNGEPFLPVPRLSTDWPTYMQNNLHQGFSLSPAPMTSEILWTAPVCDSLHVFENPVVVDGNVYHVGIEKVFSLDAATGAENWSFEIGEHDDAPACHEGMLYVASDSIYCIDALTGERQWAFYGADLEGGTPCVMNGIVACATGSYQTNKTTVFGLIRESGAVAWSSEIEGAIGNCIAGWNGMFFVGTYMGPLCALDALTGEVLWANSATEGGYWDTSPTLLDGKIYIGGYDGAVHRFDALTGDLEWETQLGTVSTEPTPAVFGDMVLCGNIGFGSSDGCVAALACSDGSIQWSIPGSLHGSVAIADGVAFWGGCHAPYDNICAADAATGNIIWEYHPNPGEWGLQGTPSVTDGVMYFGSTDGNLYAFGTGLKWTYRDDLYAQVGEQRADHRLLVRRCRGRKRHHPVHGDPDRNSHRSRKLLPSGAVGPSQSVRLEHNGFLRTGFALLVVTPGLRHLRQACGNYPKRRVPGGIP